ncbi:hypothetical protein JRO89_XS03G0058600 [Xanthoceras sorbifolium]|uniref:E3 ubiquitin-protein ligase PRT1 n=1 Tax=Xanthoceras sorbifolium TaxID=99658 RepID=A0ABQ8I9T3_9ROSI|nr:hypothetical protein JRO89_XS03G0058600 [Xanthoceras sorbifolium]
MENRKESKDTNNNSIAVTKQKQQEEEDNAHEDDEDFHEEFRCCVCLELLYKPVVLACGHISCFWCVYNAMNILHESHCPVCRHPYNHFPSICQLLHFLLMKLYPVTYVRRERQVGEEEKKVGHFSPQFDQQLFGSNPNEGLDILEIPLCSPSCQQTTLYSESHCSGEGKSSSCMNLLEDCGDDTTFRFASSSETLETTGNAPDPECSLLGNELEHKAQNHVSVNDLPCAACKRMLFRPVVLNCGHVFCELCVVVPEDGNSRCPVCQSLHPHGLPSVCLILEHFLEEQFPQLYARRREASLKQINCSTQAQQRPGRILSSPKNVYESWWLGNGPKVHVGAGCDFCGMYPIIGERYKCKDCVEKIGFDLCEACYNNPVKIPGRFNQQHKPEHQFEIIQPSLLYRLDAEFSDDDGSDTAETLDGVSRAPIMASDAPQDLEDDTNDLDNVSPANMLSAHFSLDQEDDFDDPSSDLPF